MPQIAQQDWAVVKLAHGMVLPNDAAGIARVIDAVQRGYFFDLIIVSAGGTHYKLTSYSVSNGKINVGENSTIYTFLGRSDTYRALSIVQLAQDEIKGSAMSALPTLGKTSNLLWATNAGAQAVIVSEDGFAYNVTASGGKITGISKSTTTAEAAKTALSLSDVIVLPEEEAATLVGYTITDND